MILREKPMLHNLYDRVNLTLSFEKKNYNELREICSRVEELLGKEIDLGIKVHREKRSLDANAYMWVLVDKIADKTRSTKTDIYQKAIREVGVFHDMAVQEKDAETVENIWKSNGVGWFTEVFNSPLRNCVRMRFYHGSSLYDTKQMSRLIDYIVDEAKELNIETMSPTELESMKAAWGDA